MKISKFLLSYLVYGSLVIIKSSQWKNTLNKLNTLSYSSALRYAILNTCSCIVYVCLYSGNNAAGAYETFAEQWPLWPLLVITRYATRTFIDIAKRQ